MGVTHECDFPAGVEFLPHLTRSRVAPAGRQAAAIDRAVSEQGGSLYDLDADTLAELRPDLILTQEQCDVCAVNEATVRRVAMRLPGSPRVESVNPTDLAGVFAMFDHVATLLDARAEADALRTAFDDLAELIVGRVGDPAPIARSVAALLEWLDPPFSSGHWNPELIAPGRRCRDPRPRRRGSRTGTWEAVAAADPEVILLSPCETCRSTACEELPAPLLARPEWRSLEAVQGTAGVALIDGSAYFSRPGPRLKQSLAIAAAAIHPEACRDLAPADGLGLLRQPRPSGSTATRLRPRRVS